MKIYTLLIGCFLLICCQNNNTNLKAHDSEFDCHMCPGYLVVTKNNLLDTINTGSWGKVQGVYNVVKIIDKDYVVIESSYFSGGWIEKLIHIYSTEKDSFLDLIFSKTFYEQEESYEKLEDGNYKLQRINRDYKFTFQENKLIVDIDSTLSYLIEPSMDLIKIKSGSTQEHHLIE